MQQRQLRLGDILDDYCPRERRITNHAIVAMVGPDIKQTRCTTCDAEHAYKGGKIPVQRKKKDAKASLYDQVLTAVTEKDGSTRDVPAAAPPPRLAPPDDSVADVAAVVPADAQNAPHATTQAPAVPVAEEEGRVHRALIRATLPRVEGQPAARPVPEFTVRQARASGGRFHGHQAAGSRPPHRPSERARPGRPWDGIARSELPARTPPGGPLGSFASAWRHAAASASIPPCAGRHGASGEETVEIDGTARPGSCKMRASGLSCQVQAPSTRSR